MWGGLLISTPVAKWLVSVSPVSFMLDSVGDSCTCMLAGWLLTLSINNEGSSQSQRLGYRYMYVHACDQEHVWTRTWVKGAWYAKYSLHILLLANLLIVSYGKTRNLQTKESHNRNPTYGNTCICTHVQYIHIHAHYHNMCTCSLLPRLLPDFQCWTQKNGRAWEAKSHECDCAVT